MLLLFETPAGYAIFKVKDEGKLQQTDNLWKEFETQEGASQILQLQQFIKFKDTADALAATVAIIEGRVGKRLKSALKSLVAAGVQEQLALADSRLGAAIRDKFELPCVWNAPIQELHRCVREQLLKTLPIPGLAEEDLNSMRLGLAHSLARYKLKFSPDKVDTMIVQAVSLIDELDKELNNYIMRAREWYGWHFPELGRIVTDHREYAKLLTTVGDRRNFATTDLTNVLDAEKEKAVKLAAETSMGTEISEEDLINIKFLTTQILEMTDYRNQLFEYLQNRMMAIAPNLSVLVGELVGARLIAHAGSLINLAKQPASTVQILGAEKALFRALKTRKNTPKYGLIYHATLIGQSDARLKGKMSRMLAAKAALAVRYDALNEETRQAATDAADEDGVVPVGAPAPVVKAELGLEHRSRLEARLRQLEDQQRSKASGFQKGRPSFERYQNKSEVLQYNTRLDSSMTATPKGPVGAMKSEPRDQGTPSKRPKIEVVSSTEAPVDTAVALAESGSPKKHKRPKSLVPAANGNASMAEDSDMKASTAVS